MTTDAVRRPPAELVQSMLTLAHMTDGKATFQVGAGERKQTAPFGHPTNQGMSRMKDLFQIFRRFMESDGPFDFEGRRWTFEGAFLGGARPHRPALWGLGGGPQLLDYTTSWADGLAIAVPNAWSSPEMAAEQIATVRAQVAAKGRDPDAFRIGLWACALMHDDADALDAALANPILKWVCGAMGRVEADAWKRDGLPLPFPDGWAYYKDLLPYAMDGAFVDEVVAAVTPEHQRAGFLVGTPAEVAAQIRPYVDAGADWVCAFDYLPVVGDPADAPNAGRRMVELCSLIRAM
jgi:phthiodiolone/phenolphthiodiolone dimycocerosates ketoreductase